MNPFTKLYNRKSTTIPKVPLYLDIELTNYCNLKCKMCGTNYSKRKKGYMSNETFALLEDIVSKYKIPVRIIGWGEPTKHPKYKEFIEILMFSVPVHVNTNGYKQIPYVSSVKISYHNQKEVHQPYAKYIDSTTTDYEKDPRAKRIQRTDFRWIDGRKRTEQGLKRFKRCPEVFDKLTIQWNGDITFCCGDVEGKGIIGNINNDDLIDVWQNNKELNRIRKELRAKNWNCHELCKYCGTYIKE